MQINQTTLNFIESLYRKKALLLFRYAETIFNNPSIAEEAVQETFIIACLKYQAIINSPNPEGWLMNTHKNVCKNIQKSQTYYAQRILSLNEIIIQAPDIDPLHNTENDLSVFVTSEDFMILKKIILYGYSHKDLAEELNISVDASKKRFQRAKQRFQKKFQERSKFDY